MSNPAFKDFWDKMQHPAHAHTSDEWFDRYAKEILFFLNGAKSIADAGCGSGEILIRVAPHFQKVFALDFSESMLNQAKEKVAGRGLSHVELSCDNILNIHRHCPQPVDAVYSNGVVQYLQHEELEDFISHCKEILNADGKIILLNIPNVNSRILFLLGFFRHEEAVSFFRIVRGLAKLSLLMLQAKWRNPRKKFDDGIGNWFSIAEIKRMGMTHGFSVDIYGTSVVNYYYRFHAILSRGKTG